MSTVRIQIRRGLADDWTSVDPALAAGEIGLETDTNKFKFGTDGVETWSELPYANVPASDLGNTLEDYVLQSRVGGQGGVAGLDTNKNVLVPGSSIIVEGATNNDFETTLTVTDPTADRTITFPNASGTVALTSDVSSAVSAIIDSAPGALDTLNEIAAALNDDGNAYGTIMGRIDSELTTIGNTYLTTTTAAAQYLTINDASGTYLLPATAASTYLAKADATADYLTKAAGTSEIGTAVSNHSSDTTNVHGISNTADLATQTYADTAVSTHNSDTTSVHGISDTAELATKTYADSSSSTAVSTHSSDTTSVHGIADTADLLLKSGGTMTGALTLSADPSSSLHAATKQYVDNTASGIVAKPQVLGATTANIDATYNNGTAGVGATLTHNTNGEFPAAAGGASGWAVGKGILVKNQTNKAQNGRYYISDMGSVSTPYVLTRCGYCDQASEIPGAYIFVQDGTSAGTGWIQVVADPATFEVGTDNIDVFQFSGSGTITAGTNISVSGNEVSVVATPSLSGVQFSDGTQTKQGVPSLTPIIAKTDSYTLSSLTERDSLIEVNKSTATTITIPADASVNYPVGTTLDILQTSTGQVTIAGAGGVTVNATPGLKLRTTWSSCTLFKRAANTWVVYGDLTA